MAKMNEGYMNLLSDRDHLLMVAEMYNCALKKEEEVYERIHSKWEATCDSLKRTQESLQNLRLHIYQLIKELNVPHPPSCMENDHVHMVGATLDVLEEPHMEDKHEEGAYL